MKYEAFTDVSLSLMYLWVSVCQATRIQKTIAKRQATQADRRSDRQAERQADIQADRRSERRSHESRRRVVDGRNKHSSVPLGRNKLSTTSTHVCTQYMLLLVAREAL